MKNSKSLVLGALAAVSGLLAGCGEESIEVAVAMPAPVAAAVAAPAPAAPAVVAPAPVPGGPAYDPATATCTVNFKARVKGTPPKMRSVKFDADPKCMGIHTEEVAKQDVVADKEGRLANVIVYVSKGSDRWTFAPKTEAASIDQKGCMYNPHVLTVMVNQPITIKNSDPTMHNIHAVPTEASDEFNKSQQAGAGDLTVKFTKEEVAVKVKCDVHSWMGAKVGVFAHPFHGVTGADGSFSLKLPPGDYEVSAWHEYEKWVAKPEAVKVTVAGTEAKDVELVFEAK
jgi:plastocyanin